ncbi:MAG TPA: hypothetical protein VLX92_33975, partial [Kofleriaceae bacterium]|nr:hypothetical protein [Kofleriaceae bacterium]
MGLARGALVALVACSSHATHTVEDARSASRAEPPPSHDAPLAPPAGPYRVDDHPGPAGDATIRVEWPEAPAALRASTGRTPCGTARPPAIAPTTMWGIPDVVVAVLPEHGEAAPQREARIVLDRCALEPRVAVAGATLAITGTAAAPAELAI